MHEICQSGSEGGAKTTFVPTPISAQGFNPGKYSITRFALKGREITWVNSFYACVLPRLIWRPFRAHRLGAGSQG
jgi:hypothetical protein